MSIDAKDFRRALGKFPTGVTVITTTDDRGERIGVTASSFNSVSIEPALVLWSIDKGAYSLQAFTEGRYFTINVLRDDQVEISNRFARRGDDKFAGLEMLEDANGCPRVPGAAAWFACRTWSVYDGGDHFIIVGEVTDYGYEDNVGSLVFHNGRYAVPEVHPGVRDMPTPPVTGGFLNDYLLYQMHQALSACRESFYPTLTRLGITAEEWRVLSVLADAPDTPVEAIAQQVSQPVASLRETLEWLRDKGLIEVDSGLSESGRTLIDRVRSLAIEHEQQVLGRLSASQRDVLKECLRILAAPVAH
ncbi:flavin oxidoreductase [Marinobacterium zhoushanense]|uniref:Flavin oxidoreductase n=1 Tax=Marinobacterium zhoushanense TaxID=1679163 RepID=A0ABQ1K5F8_9GAMM|nr:flavin reductase [Marinobacterium zhoushanense]GGB84677.1 flavin oxidoreductase [Marinobacterium zhoushanense]